MRTVALSALRTSPRQAPPARPPSATRSLLAAPIPLGGHAFPRGAMLVIEDAVGLRLTVLSGEVWITEERSFVDLVIGAGEACPLTRPGLAVMEVHGDARLVLERVAPDARVRTVRARMTGAGPWMLLYARPGPLARAGAALDRAWRALASVAADAVRPLHAARMRRALQVRD